MDDNALLLALLDEGYQRKTWHGPNLRQSLKGVTAKQAAWRPGSGRHGHGPLLLANGVVFPMKLVGLLLCDLAFFQFFIDAAILVR